MADIKIFKNTDVGTNYDKLFKCQVFSRKKIFLDFFKSQTIHIQNSSKVAPCEWHYNLKSYSASPFLNRG